MQQPFSLNGDASHGTTIDGRGELPFYPVCFAVDQRFQTGFYYICIFKADDFLPQNALSIVKESCGQAFNASKFIFQLIGSDGQRVTDPKPTREDTRLFYVCHGIQLESDNSESMRAIAVGEFLIPWHFFLARLTPGGPEIDEYHLAA